MPNDTETVRPGHPATSPRNRVPASALKLLSRPREPPWTNQVRRTLQRIVRNVTTWACQHIICYNMMLLCDGYVLQGKGLPRNISRFVCQKL